jgi:hypothetical protein
MFEIERIRDELVEAVETLDTDGLDAGRARRIFEAAADIERLGANAKTLAAMRIEGTGGWRGEGDPSMAHWVARKTGASLAHAADTVKTAARLDPWGATAEAMKSGEVSAQQASAITDACVTDPDAETDLLTTAANDTMEGLRAECRRVKAAAEVDPMAKHRALHRARRAHGFTDADGAFCVEARFTPEAGAQLWARIRADGDDLARAAKTAGGPVESSAAYRADALVRLATGNAVGTSVRKVVTVRARIDARAWVTGELRPGDVSEIVGAGPVPPDVMADFAVDALIYGIVTHGTDLTHVQKLGGEIPAALRRAVLARTPECSRRTCHETHNLEIDHTQPRARQGPHSLENLKPLCQFDHALKTYFGWQFVGTDELDLDLVPPDGERAPPGDLELAV